MTNEELYKNDIERISKEDKPFRPAVRNGKPSHCRGTNCNSCDLYIGPCYGCKDAYEKWLKSEAEPSRKGK